MVLFDLFKTKKNQKAHYLQFKNFLMKQKRARLDSFFIVQQKSGQVK